MKIKYFIPVLLVLLLVSQAVPTDTLAQESNDDLLSAIRQIVADAVADLKTEIADLKNQLSEQQATIQSLRRAAESNGSGVGQEITRQISELKNELRNALFGDRDFRKGDFDPVIGGFQECLVEIGELSRADFESGRGTYGPRTTAIISKLQRQYGLFETGIFDQQGRNALFLAAQAKNACGIPPGITFEELERGDQPSIPAPQPTTMPTEVPTVVTPSESRIIIHRPQQNQILTPGSATQFEWEVIAAPIDSWIIFKLRNLTTGVESHVYGPATAGSGVYTNNNVVIPDGLHSGNYKLVGDLLIGDSREPNHLFSVSIFVSISGIATEEPQTTTTEPSSGLSEEDALTDKYKGAIFINCMNAQGSAGTAALAKIHGWVDSGLLRSQFPWGDLQGAEADAVPPCEEEAGISYGGDYNNYSDCLNNTDEQACSLQSGCKWFNTFCSESDYQPEGSCTGLDQAFCESEPSGYCYWYQEKQYCSYDPSGTKGGTSDSMYGCFYPDATINDVPPGFTIWCEYDYQNCHEGDSSGALVSLEGLMLGAPSVCESGGPTANTAQSLSLLANTLLSLQKIISNIANLFTR